MFKFLPLVADEDFMKASQVLLTWLERGDVNRRNINSFYSMIQCTNAHIRRLLQEKTGHEEELTKMKEKFKNIFEGILRQCKYLRCLVVRNIIWYLGFSEVKSMVMYGKDSAPSCTLIDHVKLPLALF